MSFSSSIAAWIFAITVALSAIGLLGAPTLIDRCLFRPYWLVRRQQYATLVTSGLVHADFGHLLFNMVTFFFFAFPLEGRVGPIPFFVLYIVALLLSHLWTYWKHRTEPEYASLGASGAISAVVFAYIVYFPTARMIVFPIPLPIPAPLYAIAYLAFTYYSSRQERGRINHEAHLGGALTGLLFVAVFEPSAYSNLLGMLG